MNTNLPQPVTQRLYRECIIKVLGIGRVDCKGRHITHISALSIVLGRNCTVNLGSSLFNVLLKLIRQVVLEQYCVHLGIIIARSTQNINKFANRHLVTIVPMCNTHRNLIARLYLRILFA